MVTYKLGAVETKFADIVWSSEPLSTRDLVTLCSQELNWKRTTTYSVLKKLCEKGFFKMENSVVTALITKEEYNAIQSEQFLDETFHGSLPAMLVAFGSRKKLTKKEAEELHEAINKMRG